MGILKKLYEALIAIGTFLQPFFLLAVRLLWGWLFFQTGLGKFADIESVAGYFASIGIPSPLLNAYAAATTEMVGGALLFLGLGARLVAIPLMVTMIVALLTAHSDATLQFFDEPVKILVQLPFTFFMAALTIFVFGPGKISLDAAIKKFLGK